MRLGSPSPASRAFLDQHPFVDEDAVDLFRDASGTVRRAVIDEGPLKGTRNPSSALMERVQRLTRTGGHRW
eukprot:3328694-Alexandrium_andersonii.AAC.1